MFLIDALKAGDLVRIEREMRDPRSMYEMTTLRETPLHFANGAVPATPAARVETATRLLDSGPGVDDQGNAGRTPLWYATGRGHLEVVELLLKCGADAELRARGKQGSPMDVARSTSNIEAVRLLEGESRSRSCPTPGRAEEPGWICYGKWMVGTAPLPPP